MTPKIIVLNSSPSIKPYLKGIKREAEESLVKVQNVLKVSDVDIVIFENPEATIKHLGVGGFSPNKNTVLIYLDSKHKNFKKHLLGTMAHELHHAKRWGSVGYGKTLLDAMISEGLADHFEIEVRGGKPGKWDTALNLKDIIKFKKLAAKEYHSKSYNHSDWFFGNKKRGIPQWTGYTLGFHLVSEYLMKHLNEKASKLVGAQSNIFIN